jgi:thioredoxin-dependent peroxiredoxin
MSPLTGAAAGIGTAAPLLDLPTATGERRTLAEFKGRPTLISFLGPAHCLFCRAHVIRVIQARDEIGSLGAEVILVAYHDPEMLTTKMLHDLDLPYTLLLDSTRATYARWGLGQANLQSMLSPGLYWATFKVLLRVMFKRERALGTSPNATQLGGDFVVDPSGKLVYVNRMTSFHDRARMTDLLAALRCAPT